MAKREYETLGRQVSEQDRALVLRQPQLQTAQAALEAAKAAKRAAEAGQRAAEAARKAAVAMKESATAAAKAAEASKAAAEVALRKARLDLERTTIRAPFNAIVESEAVDLGSQVSAQARLAALVGTDVFWVEVSVPVDELQWIRVPRARGEAGSAVRVYNEAAWGTDVSRAGVVVRLASALEEEGRMARLLVAVDDPLGLRDPSGRIPPLLIGSYVRVEIEGNELNGVVPVEREHLHDGDHVWVMGADGGLGIRTVEIAYRGRNRVLVSRGLETGDRMVTSDLPAPVQDMPLRTRESPGTPDGGAGKEPRLGTATEATQP